MGELLALRAPLAVLPFLIGASLVSMSRRRRAQRSE